MPTFAEISKFNREQYKKQLEDKAKAEKDILKAVQTPKAKPRPQAPKQD